MKKKRKGIRLSIFISLCVCLNTLICMLLLVYILNRDLTQSMGRQSLNNLQTALCAQTNTITQFIKNAENSLAQFSQASAVRELLKSQNDAKKTETAQEYLDRYYSGLTAWEGLYIADWTSTQLAHCNRDAIGKAFRTEPDALKDWQDSMLASNNGLVNQGAFVSPTTGEMLLNMRMLVKDDNGNPIGAVGGGPFVSDLYNVLENLTVQGMETSQYYILDTKNKIYVTSADESEIGKEVEDETLLQILAEVESGIENDTIEAVIKGDPSLLTFNSIPEYHMVLVMFDQTAEIYAESKIMMQMVLVICTVIFLVIVIMTFIISAIISIPFGKITKELDILASGEIHQPLKISSHITETELIVDATETLRSSLSDIVMHIKREAAGLMAVTATLDGSSGALAESAEQISGAVEDLAKGAAGMAEDVQNMNEGIMGMGEATDEISGIVSALDESSKQMSSISDDASECMNAVMDSSRRSVEAAANIVEQLDSANASISKINDAVSLIQGIASQTNLLSLNASIEAARAGEAGRGFAVVAEEIGKLAQESDQTAENIKALADEITKQSIQSVTLAGEIKDMITLEQEKVKETQDNFIQVSNSVSDNIEKISVIALKTAALQQDKDGITGNVQNLSAISQQNAASNQEVTASVQLMSDNIREISDEASGMKDATERLNQAISMFKDD